MVPVAAQPAMRHAWATPTKQQCQWSAPGSRSTFGRRSCTATAAPARTKASQSPQQEEQQQSQQQQQPRAARAAKHSPLPEPSSNQQTLRRSFTVGGIGLHTGNYAVVRVMPAFAGEGRYFVRVPPGTNSRLWELEQPQSQQLEEAGPAGPFADRNADMNAQLFFEFVQSQVEGFVGTFSDYLEQRTSAQSDTLLIDAAMELLPEEEPSLGEPGENRVRAHVDNLQLGSHWCTVLSHGADSIQGAEHLLAALECCGVDNARVEVEGDTEVPIIDGSALGWAVEVERAGLCPAMPAVDANAAATRSVPAPSEVLTLGDGEAFISFFPGPYTRITVGVDCSADAPVIGRQWITWSPEDPGHRHSDHFRWALAPARTFFSSTQVVKELIADGLLQAGPDNVSLIGDGEDWYDPTMVRFPGDEAARHAAVDLLGDLSLLAVPGGRGLPTGHIVAYQPTHELQAAFVRLLQQNIVAEHQAE